MCTNYTHSDLITGRILLMIKLFITDLDDTLYSWIGFFIPAFYDMVDEVSSITHINKKVLLHEYMTVNQEAGSVEYPFATLSLPSIKELYNGYTDKEIREKLDRAFYRFNSTRKKLLKLFPGVKETLIFLRDNHITIIGYTDSAEENGFYRLRKLGIDDFFEKVYVSDSLYKQPEQIPKSTKTHIVHGKKPNADILKTICDNENINLNEVIYVGDSISKDMLMAKYAGVTSIWCNFQNANGKELYDKLVAISHWSEQDFQNEAKYKDEWKSNSYNPDYTINNFSECIQIISHINNL